MRTYWNYDQGLRIMEDWSPNCWTQVTCPTTEDEAFLVEELKIPAYFLDDIRDKDERARYDYDEGWQLIILRIPYVREVQSRTPHTTIPLGIILKKDVCITVCNFETNMMIDFVAYQQKRNLDRDVNNESLIGLSRLQDSLTYFQTSIRGNETLLSKLKFKLQIDELDADLIEDVTIEMTQARETTNIYSNILESTMDTYQSIINNNMNTIIRTLTSVTIILMLPTLISSFFGMNLINGMENSPIGFLIAIVLSIVISVISLLVFRHKRLI